MSSNRPYHVRGKNYPGHSKYRNKLSRSKFSPVQVDRAVLERIGRVMVCLETVCLQAPEGPDAASRLFGMFVEEHITMLGALDYDRLRMLMALWAVHRKYRPDP